MIFSFCPLPVLQSGKPSPETQKLVFSLGGQSRAMRPSLNFPQTLPFDCELCLGAGNTAVQINDSEEEWKMAARYGQSAMSPQWLKPLLELKDFFTILSWTWLFLSFCPLVAVLRIKLRIFYRLGKCTNTKLHSHSLLLWDKVLLCRSSWVQTHKVPTLAFCVKGVYHHDDWRIVLNWSLLGHQYQRYSDDHTE